MARADALLSQSKGDAHDRAANSCGAIGRPAPSPPARRRRGPIFIAIVAVAAALTGALATTAISQGLGHGFGPGHWRQGGMMGPFASALIEDRADRMVRHLAVEIDATPSSRTSCAPIIKAAVKDLLPMREKALRRASGPAHLLTQPTLNRAASKRSAPSRWRSPMRSPSASPGARRRRRSAHARSSASKIGEHHGGAAGLLAAVASRLELTRGRRASSSLKTTSASPRW